MAAAEATSIGSPGRRSRTAFDLYCSGRSLRRTAFDPAEARSGRVPPRRYRCLQPRMRRHRWRVLPALEAAHIQSYSNGGQHEVSNGLLLRRDIHSVFDAGYLTFDEDLRVVVSDRVRTEFNNGNEYRRLHGDKLRLPPIRNSIRTQHAWNGIAKTGSLHEQRCFCNSVGTSVRRPTRSSLPIPCSISFARISVRWRLDLYYEPIRGGARGYHAAAKISESVLTQLAQRITWHWLNLEVTSLSSRTYLFALWANSSSVGF